MFNMGIPELILILIVVLLVFGPGKLPEVGRAMGKGLGEFRRAMNTEPKEEKTITVEAQPLPSQSASSTSEDKKSEQSK